MKLILFAFFTIFITTVYGSAEYLVIYGADEPDVDFYTTQSYKGSDTGDNVNVYVGFESGKGTFKRFTKYNQLDDQEEDAWFQIAAPFQGGNAVLNARQGVLFLKSDKLEASRHEQDVLFKVIDGVLIAGIGLEKYRVCFSFQHGIHLESSHKSHERFYLTVNKKGIIRSNAKVTEVFASLVEDDITQSDTQFTEEKSQFNQYQHRRLEKSKKHGTSIFTQWFTIPLIIAILFGFLYYNPLNISFLNPKK